MTATRGGDGIYRFNQLRRLDAFRAETDVVIHATSLSIVSSEALAALGEMAPEMRASLR
jgi:hypothetical protein